MGRRIVIIAAAIYLAALAMYSLSAIRKAHDVSPANAHFDLLADSFLHGRLFLVDPPSTYDLTFFNGNWFVPFPPLPALLMLPLVAIFGVNGMNTVLFSVVIGAVNVMLMFLILQALSYREWIKLKIVDNLWLTILFGIGSIHWYVAIQGTVWFVSQICTIFPIVLAVWTAIVFDSPILSGALLGAAMLARPHTAFLYPLFIGIAMAKSTNAESHEKIKSWAVRFVIPVFVAILALLAYNWARFGNPFDFGYQNQNVYPEMIQDLQTFGQFNFHYFPRNFWAMFLALPQWDSGKETFLPLDQGMSVFITTPALIFLSRATKKSPLVVGAWISIAVLLIPLLTYYNTGAAQFGYRFSLDLMVPAMILLAIAGNEKITWVMRALIMAGILVNAWGVIWFGSA